MNFIRFKKKQRSQISIKEELGTVLDTVILSLYLKSCCFFISVERKCYANGVWR